MSLPNVSKEITRDIFTWLNQIAKDPCLPSTTTRVAIVLTNFVNRNTVYAWPSVERIAKELAISETTARRALKALEAYGHVNIWEGGGRSGTNRYYPTIKHSQNCEGYSRETLSDLNTNPTIHETKPSQDCYPNNFNNQHKNHFMNKKAHALEKARTRKEQKEEEEILRLYLHALGSEP